MTTVLTVSALDLGADKLINYMGKVCNGWATKDGRTQVRVNTPATLDASAGENPGGSIYIGASALNDAIRSTKGPKVVFGYSQGAQVAGTWLRRFAHAFDAPDHRELTFLLIGNPERKYGQQPWTKKSTPDDTQYTVRDVARRGDRWANYQGYPKNKFAAMFGGDHTNYWKTDPYDPRAEIVRVVGNTTYVLVP